MQRDPIVGIPLRGHGNQIHGFSVIDAEDWPRVSEYTWHLSNRGYAVSRIDGSMTGLHRFILDAKPGETVDHINHDQLDNRKLNIRVVAHAENMQNRAGGYGMSGVRGVHWYGRKGKWVARAKLKGRVYHLGYYDTVPEAEMVVTEWRRRNMPFSTEAAA